MEVFSDDVQKYMLGKEWLAKVDNETSTPYLLKFHASGSELSCSLMITDTKSVWFETLTSNRLARRWRECHPPKSKTDPTPRDEELWRGDVLKCLSAIHTIGNFAELSFEVVKSPYSDLAFELQLEDFSFRWETNYAGPRISAEVISTQIIKPLMSTAYLAFSTPSSAGEMSGSDLEIAVDKLGRTARRMPGMHVRNSISKPRLATTIRRMTAMLNFLVEIPNIQLDVEKLDIVLPDLARATVASEIHTMDHSSEPPDITTGEPAVLSPQDKPDWLGLAGTKLKDRSSAMPQAGPSNTKPDDDSATEDSEDEHLRLMRPALSSVLPIISVPAPVNGRVVDRSTSGSDLPKGAQKPTEISAASDPSSSSARPPPSKKVKRAVSSSSDSDESDKVVAGPSRRGARQPIKRGGRRF